MLQLIVLPNKFNNESLYLFDGIVYLDYDLYSVDGKNTHNLENDINDLPTPDSFKADIVSALNGEIPSVTNVSELMEKEQRFALLDLSRFMAEYLHLHSDDDKEEQGVKVLKQIILDFGLHSVAWQYCFKFGYDDDMRQVIINSNNASSAYSWCYHIKNELAMRDIILKSNDIDTIIYYSLLLKGKDAEVESLILNDDVHQTYIDFYLEAKERQAK